MRPFLTAGGAIQSSLPNTARASRRGWINCGRFPRGSRRSYTASPGREKALSSRNAAKGDARWAHRPACSQSPYEQAKPLPGAVASPAYYRIHSADGHRQPLLLERDPVHQAVFHRVALLVLVTQQVASHEITRAYIKPQTARGVLVAQQVRCLSLDR